MWSFERQAGRWGIGFSDRVLRFVGASAILHAAIAPLTYLAWARLWPALDDRGPVPWLLWLVTIAFVAVPVGAGWGVGLGARSSRLWASVFTGPDPAPRAWDFLFQGKRNGWIRLKLKSGTWLAGAYATSQDGIGHTVLATLRSRISFLPPWSPLTLTRESSWSTPTAMLSLSLADCWCGGPKLSIFNSLTPRRTHE